MFRINFGDIKSSALPFCLFPSLRFLVELRSLYVRAGMSLSRLTVHLVNRAFSWWFTNMRLSSLICILS